MSTEETERALRGGWDGLLAALAASRRDAASRYRELRARLVRLFEWRGLAACEDLADETLERVARKLAAGEEIRGADATRYACGVARMVAHEARRAQERLRPLEVIESSEIATPPPPNPDHERSHGCLDECLDKVPAMERALLLEYHAGDGQARISGRRRMADRLGIPLNALRVRMHRLRGELEVCLETCLEEPAEGRR
jgi:DNA-directed RNA polymerase specialized sigma24 family protein